MDYLIQGRNSQKQEGLKSATSGCSSLCLHSSWSGATAPLGGLWRSTVERGTSQKIER